MFLFRPELKDFAELEGAVVVLTGESKVADHNASRPANYGQVDLPGSELLL